MLIFVAHVSLRLVDLCYCLYRTVVGFLYNNASEWHFYIFKANKINETCGETPLDLGHFLFTEGFFCFVLFLKKAAFISYRSIIKLQHLCFVTYSILFCKNATWYKRDFFVVVCVVVFWLVFEYCFRFTLYCWIFKMNVIALEEEEWKIDIHTDVNISLRSLSTRNY